MTTKEKKEYIILGVLVVAILGVVYFSFLRKDPTVDDTAITTVPDATAALPFLPYGTDLDTKIIEDQRFRVMVPPTYPTVDMSEVGLSNPFAQ